MSRRARRKLDLGTGLLVNWGDIIALTYATDRFAQKS